MRSPVPLLHFRLFANRGFVGASIATSALAFFYCAAFFMMPLFLSSTRGYKPLAIGLTLLPTTALVATCSPIVGRLVDRFGSYPLLLSGMGLLATSAALQMSFSVDSGLSIVLPAFALMGIGWGCILGPSTVAAIGSVDEALAGVAMGASWTLHNVAGALGLALATVVYRYFAAARSDGMSDLAGQGAPTPEAFVTGYQACMALLMIVALIALGSLVLVERGAKRRGCSA
jgi:MFS family permease